MGNYETTTYRIPVDRNALTKSGSYIAKPFEFKTPIDDDWEHALWIYPEPTNGKWPKTQTLQVYSENNNHQVGIHYRSSDRYYSSLPTIDIIGPLSKASSVKMQYEFIDNSVGPWTSLQLVRIVDSESKWWKASPIIPQGQNYNNVKQFNFQIEYPA